jgi:peptidoglycan/xylan/chitin deacetylase (PgdA/CDA1 family)
MSGAAKDLAACPVVVTVNMDIEARDAANAGAAGLFGRYSYGRYGLREGLVRLLGAFRGEGVKATFFISGDDAGRHEDAVVEILQEGHEIAAQGAAVDDRQPMGPGELELPERTADTLARICGARPVGWRASNGLITVELLQALARLGYLYDSSFEDDDVPYVTDVGGGAALVELPVFTYMNDATFYGRYHSPSRVRKVWFEEFDAMHAAGSYLNLTLHSRGDSGSARGVRARLVGDFLRHVGRRPGVQFYRAGDLARAWTARPHAVEVLPAWARPDVRV